MSQNKEQSNIARIIYDAYPHADLLPIDAKQDCRSLQSLLAKVTSENIGDGLFTFMVVEIIEGGEGTLIGAIRVLEQAKADVETVLKALQEEQADQE
jgi:N-acetylglucosamine kinase-like BadF-type ATPase